MNIRYHVELSEAERCELTALVGGGKHYARKIKRAQILLAADSGLSDDDIAAAVAVGGSTVYRTKRRFVEGNLEAALNEEPRAGADRKLTSNEEALLVATACSSPPEGRARWTLELLAGAMVKLTDHDSLSRETVRRRLAENHLKPWQKDMWCIPKVDAEYVARMEDVLDLYAEQPDPKRPVVCFDESPTQLIGEARQPIPAAPGRLERFDYEYRRNGVVNLFVFLDAHRSSNVSIAASKAATGSLPRSTSGSLSETKAALESTGCSPPTRPEPKWRAPIPIPRSKSHNHRARELVSLFILVPPTWKVPTMSRLMSDEKPSNCLEVWTTPGDVLTEGRRSAQVVRCAQKTGHCRTAWRTAQIDPTEASKAAVWVVPCGSVG